MNSKWLERLNTARAWMFGVALVVAGAVWLAGH